MMRATMNLQFPTYFQRVLSPTIRTAVWLVALFIPSSLMAGSGASIYSRYGIGDIRHLPGERGLAMGGASIAVLGPSSAFTFNPAGLTHLSRTSFTLGGMYEGVALKDDQNSAFLSGGVFTGAAIAVPISSQHGITLSAGFLPHSLVNYHVVQNISDPKFPYQLKYVGNGGLTSAYLGGTYSPANNWHLGGRFSYLFGTISRETAQKFSSSQLTSFDRTTTTSYWGIGGTIGAIYSGLGKLLDFSDAQSMAIGTVFTTGSSLRTVEEHLYQYSVGSFLIGRDTVSGREGQTAVPFSFGIGLSFTEKDRYVLAGDLVYQNWNRYTEFGSHPLEMRDSYRLSFGGEILPRRDPMVSYTSRMAYRMGLFANWTPVRIGTKGINEFGVTGGVAMPIFDETRISIGLEYSIRGTTTNKLVKDNSVRMTFTLTGAERWFLRPEED